MDGGILYFLPGRQKVQPELLGITHAFETKEVMQQPISSEMTPAKAPGTMFCRLGHKSQFLRYLPNHQEWQKMPNSEVWCGYYREYTPGPADLARSQLVEGDLVTLEDGNQWQVPLVRDPEGGTRLPMFMRFDGHWQPGGMKPDDQLLWDRCVEFMSTAIEVMSRKEDEIEVSFQWDDLMEAAVHCLRKNYYIGSFEASMLNLFNNRHSASDVMCAAVSWHEFINRVVTKKNDFSADSTGTTSDGSATCTPSTSQPSLTS